MRGRDEILAEGERFRAELRKWNWAELRRESVDEAAMALARRRIIKLLDEYVAWLPEVPVSRCPDSGDIVLWRLDNVDLNGWFWEYDNPARRPTKPPVSWLAMTGALRIAGPVASAPFIADPGPETPFVIPRILEKPGVRAVVAQLPIGPHVGWPITYFGPRPGVTLVNEWGANTYPVLDRGEWLGWAESTPWSPDNDYDLRRWLESGKLLWIAPDDGSMTVHDGVDGCPYVDLPGSHEHLIVEAGKTRYLPPPPRGPDPSRGHDVNGLR